MAQEELPFMKEYRENKEAFRIMGRAVARYAIEALREPLDTAVEKAVQGAIGRQVSEGLDEFVERCLEYRFQFAMDEYWRPIRDDFRRLADSYRPDSDAADWWKTNGEDSDDDK